MTAGDVAIARSPAVIDRRYSFCVLVLPGSDDQRRAKREFQLGFRWNIQLFAFGHNLNCSGAAGSNTRTDSSALTAAGNRADTGTDGCTESGSFCRLTAAACPRLLVFGCRQRIRNTVDNNLSQLEPEFSLSRDAAGLIDVGYASTNIGAARNHFDSALIERLIEHGDECFAHLVRFTVDAVDHPNRELRSCRNRPCRIR